MLTNTLEIINGNIVDYNFQLKNGLLFMKTIPLIDGLTLESKQ